MEQRLHETFRPALRDPQPDRGGAGGRRHGGGRTAGAGAGGSEDDAAGPAQAGAGNILAGLPVSGDEWVMFCAHIDTVPHKGRVEVVIDEGVFRSRRRDDPRRRQQGGGGGLHGAGARARWKPPPVGIELLLTVAEEQGLRGAKAFEHREAARPDRLRARPRRRRSAR